MEAGWQSEHRHQTKEPRLFPGVPSSRAREADTAEQAGPGEGEKRSQGAVMGPWVWARLLQQGVEEGASGACCPTDRCLRGLGLPALKLSEGRVFRRLWKS